VVHSADDLRRHVTGGSTGLFRVIGFSFASDSEISEAEVPIFLKNEILGFKVSVDDSFGMHIG
jgi:hypothetical protein